MATYFCLGWGEAGDLHYYLSQEHRAPPVFSCIFCPSTSEKLFNWTQWTFADMEKGKRLMRSWDYCSGTNFIPDGIC